MFLLSHKKWNIIERSTHISNYFQATSPDQSRKIQRDSLTDLIEAIDRIQKNEPEIKKLMKKIELIKSKIDTLVELQDEYYNHLDKLGE
jgi:archaellum component FlaC